MVRTSRPLAPWLSSCRGHRLRLLSSSSFACVLRTLTQSLGLVETLLCLFGPQGAARLVTCPTPPSFSPSLISQPVQVSRTSASVPLNSNDVVWELQPAALLFSVKNSRWHAGALALALLLHTELVVPIFRSRCLTKIAIPWNWKVPYDWQASWKAGSRSAK